MRLWRRARGDADLRADELEPVGLVVGVRSEEELLARIVYDALRRYYAAHGQLSQAWIDAPQAVRACYRFVGEQLAGYLDMRQSLGPELARPALPNRPPRREV